MRRQVGLRGVERRAFGVFWINPRQVQEQIAVYVRRGQEDLAEAYLAKRFGVGRVVILPGDSGWKNLDRSPSLINFLLSSIALPYETCQFYMGIL
jgi:hypothetical protein